MSESQVAILRKKLRGLMDTLHQQLVDVAHAALCPMPPEESERRKWTIGVAQAVGQGMAGPSFEDRVMRGLDRPWPCSLSDLIDAHFRHLSPYMLDVAGSGPMPDVFETEYVEGFINGVVTAIIPRE